MCNVYAKKCMINFLSVDISCLDQQTTEYFIQSYEFWISIRMLNVVYEKMLPLGHFEKYVVHK